MNIFIGIIKVLEILAETIFYLSGSFFAWKGYTVWKKHIAGRRDHDLAVSLLEAAYDYRSKFHELRYPYFIHVSEISGESLPSIGKICDNERYQALINEYNQRLNDMSKARLDLKPLIMQATIFIDSKIEGYCLSLLHIERQVNAAIGTYLKSLLSGSENLSSKLDQTILFNGLAQPDNLGNAFARIIEDIKTSLHDKLLIEDKDKRKSWRQKFTKGKIF